MPLEWPQPFEYTFAGYIQGAAHYSKSIEAHVRYTTLYFAEICLATHCDALGSKFTLHFPVWYVNSSVVASLSVFMCVSASVFLFPAS